MVNEIKEKRTHVLFSLRLYSRLMTIALLSVGSLVMSVAGAAMALVCLTTTIILIDEVTPGELSRPQGIMITLAINFSLSLLGFTTIAG